MRNNKNHYKRFKDTGNPRYRLSQDEADIINKYRRIKQEAESSGLNINDVHSGWIKSKEASLYFKNPDHKQQDYKKLFNELIEEIKEYAPHYKKIDRPKVIEPHLFFCCPSDIHIGKLCRSFVSGVEYNNQIAVQRTLEGVRGCIKKAEGFHIDQVVLLLSGDLLHVDGFHNKTTKGTFQGELDGVFSDHFLIAKRLMVEVIEMLLDVADVEVLFTAGNHDHLTGWLMAQVLQAHFSLCSNVSWNIDYTMRKYFKYGKTLIGSCHGHGIKWERLPMIMADECKWWSETKYRYMFTQHVHHKSSKGGDYVGMTLESLRSPSEADFYHHSNGYQSSNNKAIESFIFHKQHGQVARLTHLF